MELQPTKSCRAPGHGDIAPPENLRRGERPIMAIVPKRVGRRRRGPGGSGYRRQRSRRAASRSCRATAGRDRRGWRCGRGRSDRHGVHDRAVAVRRSADAPSHQQAQEEEHAGEDRGRRDSTLAWPLTENSASVRPIPSPPPSLRWSRMTTIIAAVTPTWIIQQHQPPVVEKAFYRVHFARASSLFRPLWR